MQPKTPAQMLPTTRYALDALIITSMLSARSKIYKSVLYWKLKFRSAIIHHSIAWTLHRFNEKRERHGKIYIYNQETCQKQHILKIISISLFLLYSQIAARYIFFLTVQYFFCMDIFVRQFFLNLKKFHILWNSLWPAHSTHSHIVWHLRAKTTAIFFLQCKIISPPGL